MKDLHLCKQFYKKNIVIVYKNVKHVVYNVKEHVDGAYTTWNVHECCATNNIMCDLITQRVSIRAKCCAELLRKMQNVSFDNCTEKYIY